MARRTTDSNQRGFTIVELMIATTVFSIILLIAATTLIQIGRMYYKGVITSKTQNVTRSIMDDVSRSIQFSSGNGSQASDNNPPRQAYCIGSTRYTYVLGKQVSSNPQGPNQTRHALWQDSADSSNCGFNLPDLQQAKPSSDGKELLEEHMRLQDFSVTAQPQSNDTYTVNVKVIYGDDDLLDDPSNPTTCKGSVVGGQWCAISELKTVVYSRAK